MQTISERDPYRENGFTNRRIYHEFLSEKYDVPVRTVRSLSSLLGNEDDFEGLILILENHAV